MNLKLIGIVLLATLAPVQAQNTALTPPPQLEVASIKRNTSGGPPGGMRVSPGRFAVVNTPVLRLIRNAYKTPEFLITGGPGWINSEQYDIEAKAEGEFTGDGALLMLRTILEDRLRLKVRRETREGPVYLLSVAKGGPKLPRSSCIGRDPGHPPPPVPNQDAFSYCGTVKNGSDGPSRTLSLTGVRMSVPDSAGATYPGLDFDLSGMLERPVIDKTELEGMFDVNLTYTTVQAAPSSASDSIGPSIFTALREQLGLKLESSKGSAEFLVIHHIERPSEN